MSNRTEQSTYFPCESTSSEWSHLSIRWVEFTDNPRIFQWRYLEKERIFFFFEKSFLIWLSRELFANTESSDCSYTHPGLFQVFRFVFSECFKNLVSCWRARMQLRRLSSSHAIVTNAVFQTTFKLTYFILQPKSLGKGKVIGISGNVKYQT